MVRFTSAVLCFVASSMALSSSNTQQDGRDVTKPAPVDALPEKAVNGVNEWLDVITEATTELNALVEETRKEMNKKNQVKKPEGQKPNKKDDVNKKNP
ncbi:hypothetical protein QQS21_000431 [Conoideocrella luteorostrata]|uniref:Secreted protein n=1 Tax=Conoideocrella luteorostrata TaxID=1105319 RepID=A0AAJ0CZ30_9HYPO|nr:hypothetical protein QQS21_000431 [Conoideocrella luteorostrata]